MPIFPAFAINIVLLMLKLCSAAGFMYVVFAETEKERAKARKINEIAGNDFLLVIFLLMHVFLLPRFIAHHPLLCESFL